MVECQFKKRVRVVRRNGTELMCLKPYFAAQGIPHQISCVRTPQQNERVECLLTGSFLINRTPTRLLDGKTPYDILFGEPPTLEHF